MNRSPFAGKHLLLVGTGGVKRRKVLEALRSLGLARITCLHDKRNWAAPYVDDWIEADPARISAATIDAVRSHVKNLDGVMTYDEYSVVVAAHLAHAFELVGIPPQAAEQAKDKATFRRICSENGLPAPRFARIDPESHDLRRALNEAGVEFPVVVKPTHGGGSVLVRRADDLADLERTLSGYVPALALEPAAALWPDRSVLVEEYLSGDEVDIDILIQDGELRYAAVTDNFAPIEPYFMEMGGQIPSALPEPAQRELINVAREVLLTLGVRDSCVHFEARWTRHGAVPIEANLRVGGAEVYEFNRSAYGVDLVEGAVRIALGIPVEPSSATQPRSYLRSTAFNPPRTGRLRSIEIEPWVDKHPGLAELVFFREPGEQVRVPPDGFDYIGWMVARGQDRAEADAHLAALAAGIRFEIAPSNGSRHE